MASISQYVVHVHDIMLDEVLPVWATTCWFTKYK